MRNYDFNEKLEWWDFQNLACQVVQQREQVQLQTFRQGADEGADGLWFDERNNTVVQAKRYKNFKDLYHELSQRELAKVGKLNPDRYILVVSLKLSKAQFDKICLLFKDYIKESKDLLDANALNNLLSQPQYHHIEKEYTKLWIPNTTVMEEILEQIINKGQRNRNINAYERALRMSGSFVQTDMYNQALDALNRNHTVIISGEPGMGKTTLARILALEFLEVKGYEGFIWAENLNEAESMWDYGSKKQVFILDDFWGANFYGEGKRKTSAKLEEFIWRIKEDENKRLIITSREYIIQQEIYNNPELGDVIENLKIQCVLRGYSDAEKARILFSHLKNSDLEYEYVMSIFYSCDRIVHNPGYSPRIIEKFLKQNNSYEYTPAEYAEALLDFLEYPENFWKEIFMELSEESKIVAMIIAISYSPIDLDDIRETYANYIKLYSRGRASKSFEACVSELEKTWIFTYWDDEFQALCVSVDNPSVIDFLYSYISENQEFYVPKLCNISFFYNQLLSLLNHVYYKNQSVKELVEGRCVKEFYSMPMKLEEYGEPEFGESVCPEIKNLARRAFYLMKVSRPAPESRVWSFLEGFVRDFFKNMDENPLFDKVYELTDFIDLVGVCEEGGMRFNSKEIMEEYWKHAFLAEHYDLFEEFEKIYPNQYRDIKEGYESFMQENIKDIILESLIYLEDWEYDDRLDMFLAEVPDILKKYNLRYTPKYKERIKNIAGICYEGFKYSMRFQSDGGEENVSKDQSYENAKEKGFEQLFPNYDDALEDGDLIRVIKRIQLNSNLKKDLIDVIEKREPWYAYEILKSEAEILLLKDFSQKYGLNFLPQGIDMFINLFIFAMAREEPILIKKMISFCRIYTLELLYKKEPVISEKGFRKLPVYKELVEGDEAMEEALFRYILYRDEKWIWVKNEVVLLYFFCRALIYDDDFEWNIFRNEELCAPLIRFDGKRKEFYYPEIMLEPYMNYEWKNLIIKIFPEIDNEEFCAKYVKPQIEGLLEKMEGDDEVMSLLKHIKLSVHTNGDERTGQQMFMPEEVDLLETLGVASIHDMIYDGLTEDSFNSLQKRKNICRNSGRGDIIIDVYKEKDIDFLKECGIYHILEDFLKKTRDYLEHIS